MYILMFYAQNDRYCMYYFPIEWFGYSLSMLNLYDDAHPFYQIYIAW